MSSPALDTQILSQTAAALAIDPVRPLGPHALVRWHDKIGGPKDLNGRRLWTPQVCEAIREARAAGRAR